MPLLALLLAAQTTFVNAARRGVCEVISDQGSCTADAGSSCGLLLSGTVASVQVKGCVDAYADVRAGARYRIVARPMTYDNPLPALLFMGGVVLGGPLVAIGALQGSLATVVTGAGIAAGGFGLAFLWMAIDTRHMPRDGTLVEEQQVSLGLRF